jgi:hypothetical protein
MERRNKHLVNFIFLLYFVIAVGVFKYRHPQADDMDIIKNLDSVIFFQMTVIEGE